MFWKIKKNFCTIHILLTHCSKKHCWTHIIIGSMIHSLREITKLKIKNLPIWTNYLIIRNSKETFDINGMKIKWGFYSTYKILIPTKICCATTFRLFIIKLTEKEVRHSYIASRS